MKKEHEFIALSDLDSDKISYGSAPSMSQTFDLSNHEASQINATENQTVETKLDQSQKNLQQQAPNRRKKITDHLPEFSSYLNESNSNKVAPL